MDDIRIIIRPCGLSPRKSKAIHELSKILVNKYNGEIPQELHLLEELPELDINCFSRCLTSIWHTRFSCRYPYSSTSKEVGNNERKNVFKQKKVKSISKKHLEQIASSNHFLWKGIFTCKESKI